VQDLLERMAEEARRGDMDIDRPVYAAAERDPTWPILLGSGSLEAPIGVLGRDPGRFEVIHAEPFIGKGGQLIRDGFHRARFNTNCPDIEASIEVGRDVFWCNTVPYKPSGNKAWSMKVKRRFVNEIAELITERWKGHDLLTCGNVAFDWFRVADPSLKPALAEFWRRTDRYEATLEIALNGKELRLHPLPHPSPLNATWYPKFPGLLDARLQGLSFA